MFRREPINVEMIANNNLEETKKLLEEGEKIKRALRDERYKNIIDFILNSSKLNYNGTKLIIDYGEVVLEYINAIEPEKYKEKYNELKQHKEE